MQCNINATSQRNFLSLFHHSSLILFFPLFLNLGFTFTSTTSLPHFSFAISCVYPPLQAHKIVKAYRLGNLNSSHFMFSDTDVFGVSLHCVHTILFPTYKYNISWENIQKHVKLNICILEFSCLNLNVFLQSLL